MKHVLIFISCFMFWGTIDLIKEIIHRTITTGDLIINVALLVIYCLMAKDLIKYGKTN